MVGDFMSSDNDDYSEWFKKRRSQSKDPFFGNIDDMFREMEKMMDEELKNFTDKVPKEYVKERKLPDGSTVKELGPFVYGYSMKIGPDGKPEIQEFGNIKKGLKGAPQVKDEREPLVDIMETNDDIHVVVELPGVEKTDIKLHGTEDFFRISLDIRLAVSIMRQSSLPGLSDPEPSEVARAASEDPAGGTAR